MNASVFHGEKLLSCFLLFLTILSLPKVLAFRRKGATSGHRLHEQDPLWLQRYRWAWRDLNSVLALPTRLLSLVLGSMPDGVSVCDQGRLYNHRTHRGTGGRGWAGLCWRSKDSRRRKEYIFSLLPQIFWNIRCLQLWWQLFKKDNGVWVYTLK